MIITLLIKSPCVSRQINNKYNNNKSNQILNNKSK